MRHAGNIPHRVLAFNIAAAESNWRSAGHPLCGFVFDTRHPDIELGAALKPLSARQRFRVRALA
jgi:hypothetical protein